MAICLQSIASIFSWAGAGSIFAVVVLLLVIIIVVWHDYAIEIRNLWDAN